MTVVERDDLLAEISALRSGMGRLEKKLQAAAFEMRNDELGNPEKRELTAQQMEFAKAYIEEGSGKALMKRLGINVRTVKARLSRIYSALRIPNDVTRFNPKILLAFELEGKHVDQIMPTKVTFSASLIKVAVGIADGLSDTSIARYSGLSVAQVRRRTSKLLDVTGMNTRIEFARWYWAHFPRQHAVREEAL